MEYLHRCFRWRSRGAVWQNVWKRGSSSRRKHQTWWTEEVATAIGEKREIWKMIEVIKKNGEQPNTTLLQLYVQKKAARRAVDKDKAKMEMEEEL